MDIAVSLPVLNGIILTTVGLKHHILNPNSITYITANMTVLLQAQCIWTRWCLINNKAAVQKSKDWELEWALV